MGGTLCRGSPTCETLQFNKLNQQIFSDYYSKCIHITDVQLYVFSISYGITGKQPLGCTKVPTKFSLELLVARNSKPHNHRLSPSLLVPHWQICIRMYMTVCSAFELQVKTHWSSSTANTARAVTSSDLVIFSVNEVVSKML